MVTTPTLPAEGTALRLTLDTITQYGEWAKPHQIADLLDGANPSHTASNLAMLARRGLVFCRGERGAREYAPIPRPNIAAFNEPLPPEPEPEPEPDLDEVVRTINRHLLKVTEETDAIQAEIDRLDARLGELSQREKALRQARDLVAGC